MTLIALFADANGILLSGDGLRQLQNDPQPRTDVTKVFYTRDKRIGLALYGAVPFPDGHGGYLTDMWLADFAAKQGLIGATVRDVAIQLETAMRSPTLNNLGATGGGFLIAGFEGSEACAFEVRCQSKSLTESLLLVNAGQIPVSNFHRQPLLRGVYFDYASLLRDLGIPFPPDRKEQIEWFNRVVGILSSEGKPVGGQTSHVLIERTNTTMGQVDAESEINGSFCSQPPPPQVVRPDLL